MEQQRQAHASQVPARLALAQKRAVENQLSKGCGKSARQMMMETPEARNPKRDGGAYIRAKPQPTHS